MSLQSRKAIITGASRGIGFAIASAFAARGASKLYLIGRTQSQLEEAQNQLRTSFNSVQVELLVGDVADVDFWERVSGQAKDVDILVNSAGVSQYAPLAALRTQSIETIYRTNLLGTTWGCRAIGRHFLRQKTGGLRSEGDPGCVINVSSLLGVKGGKGTVAYAASKAGVIGLTRALAVEMAPLVRANVIVPGYIETDMTRAMDDKAHSAALAAIPQRRFGTPEEVAHAAVFLATNSYAQNTVLNLDGGLSAT